MRCPPSKKTKTKTELNYFLSEGSISLTLRQFESDGVDCPTKLRSNVFTTFAVDNIDHNPSSHSAKVCWHGTAISSTQNLESKADGIKRCCVQLAVTASKVLQPIPKEYTTVHFFVLKSTDVYVPHLPKRNAFQEHIFLLQIYKPEDRLIQLPTPKMRLCVTNVDRF